MEMNAIARVGIWGDKRKYVVYLDECQLDIIIEIIIGAIKPSLSTLLSEH